MNKKLFFSFSLFAILSISFLTSCENESSSMLDYKDTARRSAFVDPTMNNDTTVLCVNSLEDLQHSLSQIVNERDKQLRQKGWTKVLEEQPQTRGVLRAKRRIRTDTVYINQETVDYYSNPSVYANFNAKFSKSMVDSINKVVSPELRISTKKTYVCRWRLYGTYMMQAMEKKFLHVPLLYVVLFPIRSRLLLNEDIPYIYSKLKIITTNIK